MLPGIGPVFRVQHCVLGKLQYSQAFLGYATEGAGWAPGDEVGLSIAIAARSEVSYSIAV